MVILAKETNKENVKEICDICKENKYVYARTRVSLRHKKDTVVCSKGCFKKAYA